MQGKKFEKGDILCLHVSTRGGNKVKVRGIPGPKPSSRDSDKGRWMLSAKDRSDNSPLTETETNRRRHNRTFDEFRVEVVVDDPPAFVGEGRQPKPKLRMEPGEPLTHAALQLVEVAETSPGERGPAGGGELGVDMVELRAQREWWRSGNKTRCERECSDRSRTWAVRPRISSE